MRTIRRLFCVARGHAWETVEDPYGSITTCARCGALQHVRGGSAPDADPIMDKGGLGAGE